MYENVKFTSEESRIMEEYAEFEDEYVKLAFQDFLSIAMNSDREKSALIPLNFMPRTINDYRYIRYKERVRTLNNLFEIANSVKTSWERLEKLECPDACEHAMEMRNSLRINRCKYIGYLMLIKQLIELNDAGLPNEVIPRQAFYYGYPPSGTRVVAWNYKNPNEKWLGEVPSENYVDFYAIRIQPIPHHTTRVIEEELYNLGIIPVESDNWFDAVLPSYLVQFYLQFPDLFKKHYNLLDIPELEYIAEIIYDYK